MRHIRRFPIIITQAQSLSFNNAMITLCLSFN